MQTGEIVTVAHLTGEIVTSDVNCRTILNIGLLEWIVFFMSPLLQLLSIATSTTAKARDFHIARLTGKPDQPRFTVIEVAVGWQAPFVLQC